MKAPSNTQKLPGKVLQTFSALQYPNYRLWFYGQMVSLVGTWMQNTAQGYLIYDLTKSTEYLGYVGLAAGLPSLLITPFAGMIADRISRRIMLIYTQTAMMILAFALAALVFTKLVQPWQIVVLAFLLGVANAFDAPARLAFVVELVDRKDLTNAIALNATMFNIGTVVGPAVAGLTYAVVGPTWCFVLNGISFIAVIVALLLMHFQPQLKVIRHTSPMTELIEGFKYTLNEKIVRILIIDISIISLFGISMMVLLPAWSVEILGGDVRTNGLLMSARGVGALIAALMLAALSHRNIRGKIWTIGNLMMPFSLILFSQARVLPISMLILVFTGWSFITQANVTNALIQNRIPDALRGRVMGIYTLLFFGSMPIGSYLAGKLASSLGLPPTLIAGALVCLAAALVIFIRYPVIRRLD